ncbi:MAG: AAA family ATPase [Saprospiraceae bacterium]|nr:AAA family ATPase [Saprospiraceae bacterium]
MSLEIVRPFAEIQYANELEALVRNDPHPKPKSWKMSPLSVLTYLMGGTLKDGTVISTKYFGSRQTMELAIATLLSDRALLLMGIPGTAKTWVSEHLTAAISGDSSLLIQGTTGIHEDQLRYGWNYASLISQGPSEEALIPSPVMRAMNEGRIVRLEELTRIPTEIQDALMTILSEKILPIPELKKHVHAKQGFNLIATANDQDKGIYEMSAALKRRFNIITMPLPSSLNEEMNIVQYRIQDMQKMLEIDLPEIKNKQLEQLVTLFRELRQGKTLDGKQKVRASKAHLSPAEAISIVHHSRIQSHYFNQDKLTAQIIAPVIVHTLMQVDSDETIILREYNEAVLKKRADWKDWYQAFKELL